MPHQQSDTRWRPADAVLAASVIVAALAIWACLLWLPGRGAAVRVTVDGTVVATLPLNRDATLTIPGVDGENTLVIAGGAAQITAADCPDHICVRHRAISRPGQSIICLPHRVVVTVVSNAADVDGEV